MKKIIKPFEQEQVEYYSDFTGEKIDIKIFTDGETGQEIPLPPAMFMLMCSFGSKYDGLSLELYLSDSDVNDVIDFLKTKLKDKSVLEVKNNNEEEPIVM